MVVDEDQWTHRIYTNLVPLYIYLHYISFLPILILRNIPKNTSFFRESIPINFSKPSIFNMCETLQIMALIYIIVYLFRFDIKIIPEWVLINILFFNIFIIILKAIYFVGVIA